MNININIDSDLIESYSPLIAQLARAIADLPVRTYINTRSNDGVTIYVSKDVKGRLWWNYKDTAGQISPKQRIQS